MTCSVNYGGEVLKFTLLSNSLSRRKMFYRYISYAYSDQDYVPPPPGGKFKLDKVFEIPT